MNAGFSRGDPSFTAGHARFLWSSAVKDLRRHARDPLALLLWLLIPLIIGGLITLAFGGEEGPRPKAHVLVADQDQSFLSGLLTGALGQGEVGNFLRAEKVDADLGRQRMQEGEATALLVIPAGFARALLREEPAALELVTNPAQRILPGIVEEGLSMLVDASFYLHRLIGDDLREFADGPLDGADFFPDERVAEFSAKINQLVQRLSDLLFPPVIEFEASVEGGDAPEGDPYARALLPGVLFMALMFMAQGFSEDLWRERAERTLRRVAVSPQSVVAFLAGKVLSGAILMFGVCCVALALGAWVFHVEPERLPLGVAWATFSGAVLMAAMMWIQLYASSQRAGGLLTHLLLFPLLMLGGSFFPFAAMPPWMAAIGRRTPNGWALAQLEDILSGDVNPATLLGNTAALVVCTALLFFLSSLRIRGSFSQD